MGFTTRFFRRKWQHPDPAKRRAAIHQLQDPGLLKQVASTDPEASLRRLALLRIANEQFLLERCTQECEEQLLALMVDNLKRQESLVQIARNAAIPVRVRARAIKRLADQEFLERLAMQDGSKQVRIAATRKVERHRCLEYIAGNDRSPEVREAAGARLTGSVNATTRAFARNRSTV